MLAFDFTVEAYGVHQVGERLIYITHKMFILMPCGFRPVEVTVFDRSKLSPIGIKDETLFKVNPTPMPGYE